MHPESAANSSARLVLYREADGAVPVVAWLGGLPARVQAKLLVRLERLEAEGALFGGGLRP